MPKAPEVSDFQLSFMPDAHTPKPLPLIEEVARYEHIREEPAYEALRLFGLFNSRRAFAGLFSQEIRSLKQQGWPEYSDEVQSVYARQHSLYTRADRFKLEADECFAQAIGIVTKRDEVTDKKGVIHTIVVAVDLIENVELQRRYRVFKNLYLPTNNKRRERTNKHKIPIIIPIYSNMDRHLDRQQYFAAKKAPNKSVQPKYTIETITLAEPGEPVLAVNLFDYHHSMVDVITAFNVRKSRIEGHHNQKLMSGVMKDTSRIRLPQRLDGEKVGTYCNRERLTPDMIAEFIRQTLAKATGYRLLFAQAESGNMLVPDRAELAAQFRTIFRENWVLYSDSNPDTTVAREEDKAEHKHALIQLRSLAQMSQTARRVPAQRPGQAQFGV